ncbi:MAG: 16S rRNA (adenine(1518)-N(6)/adenine(1519)-N(6))-dimethyltransferase RsmA [Rikenellaceae bacterium]|jgi:16S rRNA (adenine1518-N6/adenine1519-N6)-dimethyltransferase|nr:16S rRNA (adenine(1518)-N(6)/adenine(1519)-N(6))-dimethyltransferase RsmA [Rikenellaceae bacterium]
MSNSVRPKKQLGQHFLTDLSIARRIAHSLRGDRAPDTLEVGPGMGVLTRFLLERKELNLYAAEIDPESVDYLRDNLPELGKRLIYDDFLKMDLAARFPDGVNIIGNFPYNISSQIFFKVLENRDLVPEVVGMLQREVAVRLAEPPGSRDYGILSVFLQAFYDIEYLFTVPEHVFNPPPKVKSGVIRIVRNNVKRLDCDEALFYRVVKTTFNQRRKTIRNSLRAGFPGIEGEHPLFSQRPEQLGVTEFVELTQWTENALAEQGKQEKE